VRRGVPEPVIASLLLPADAFRRSPPDQLALRLDRSLRAWRSYRRLTSLLRREPITTGRLLGEIGDAGAAVGVPLLVAVLPQRFQGSEADWRATAFEYGLDPGAFDLELPNRRIAAACARAGLDCADLLPAFRKEAAPTYLPLGDMHWNANGHGVAARALLPRALARLSPSSSAPAVATDHGSGEAPGRLKLTSITSPGSRPTPAMPGAGGR